MLIQVDTKPGNEYYQSSILVLYIFRNPHLFGTEIERRAEIMYIFGHIQESIILSRDFCSVISHYYHFQANGM